MTPAFDERSAARILDLAQPPRGSRSRALAGFAVILALAAHASLVGGFPESAHAAAQFLVEAPAERVTTSEDVMRDIDARLATIAGFVSQVEQVSREGQQQLETRLRERLTSLPPDLQGDAAAVGQELVRFVARSDIDEELVRLRSHFEHWKELARGPEPCGRKLDFLVQEMNREINTIGSKAEGTKATEIVIAVKAELERVREQVQNVE